MALDIFTKNSRVCRLLAWRKHYVTGVHIRWVLTRGRYRTLFSQKYQNGPASLEPVEVWPWCFNRCQGTARINGTSRHLLECRNKGGLLPKKAKSEETKVQSSTEVLAPLDLCILRYRNSGIIW